MNNQPINFDSPEGAMRPTMHLPMPANHRPPSGTFQFHGHARVTDHHIGDGSPEDPSHLTMQIHQIHIPNENTAQESPMDEANEAAAQTVGAAAKRTAGKRAVPPV